MTEESIKPTLADFQKTYKISPDLFIVLDNNDLFYLFNPLEAKIVSPHACTSKTKFEYFSTINIWKYTACTGVIGFFRIGDSREFLIEGSFSDIDCKDNYLLMQVKEGNRKRLCLYDFEQMCFYTDAIAGYRYASPEYPGCECLSWNAPDVHMFTQWEVTRGVLTLKYLPGPVGTSLSQVFVYDIQQNRPIHC